jgi:hypothetical protein
LKASLTAKELEEASKGTLGKLGCKFYTNRTAEITEFEVIEPVNLIVRISKMPSGHPFSRFGTLFGNLPSSGSNRQMSNLEIVLQEQSTSASQVASQFVDVLLGALPRKPWQGLSPFETMSAKVDWNSWLRKARTQDD